MAEFETDNQVFIQKRTAVHQARLKEDEVWLKSQRDAVVPLLDAADKTQDGYVSAARYILTAHAGLLLFQPELIPVVAIVEYRSSHRFRVVADAAATEGKNPVNVVFAGNLDALAQFLQRWV